MTKTELLNKISALVIAARKTERALATYNASGSQLSLNRVAVAEEEEAATREAVETAIRDLPCSEFLTFS